MSTRCLISAKMLGMCFTIYCHHDGYPEHIVPLLRDQYNTQEKIEALIMMGNTSAIYETLEKCEPYTKRCESYEDNAPTISAEFKRHTSYYDEYYWDGEKWLYFEDRKLPVPILKYKEDGEEESNAVETA